MIIGIDANEANLTAQRVGINQYAFELLKALHSLKTKHQFVIYLKTQPLADLPKARLGWQYRVIPFPKLWTQTRLPWDLFTHSPRPDVFFSMTHYAPRMAPMPTVVAIMDLGFLQTPEQFTAKDFNQLKSWTQYSVNQAKKVIAISQHTKQDIIREYGRKSDDVIVTPLAYDKKLFQPTSGLVRESKILFLGSLKPSKNIEGLVRAFAKLSLADLPVGTQLVIAGKKAWLYDRIFELVRSLNLEGKVVFTGFVEEKQKPILMSQASVFVMPSFYEGFGIPVLEAMACGTPVVVSNVASLPEVAGDAGIYVDPHNIDSICRGIMDAIGPKRSQWVNRGLKRVKLFSWVKTAMQTLKVLESALLVAFFWLLVTSYSTAYALTTTPYRSASIITTDGSPSYTNLGNCSATDGTTCDRSLSSSFANLYFRNFGDFGIATGSALTAVRTRVAGKANTSPYLGVSQGNSYSANCQSSPTLWVMGQINQETIATYSATTALTNGTLATCLSSANVLNNNFIFRINWSGANWEAHIDNLEVAFDYYPPPGATISYSTTNPTNQPVTAALVPIDPLTVTNNGGSSSYLFTNNGSFTFQFSGNNGTTGSATATVNNIDVTAPVSSPSATLDSDWHKTVSVSLTCNDSSSGSGCLKTYYTIDGTLPTVNSASGSAILFSTDGIYTLRYFSTDNAGNSEDIKAVSNPIKIDGTPPSNPTLQSLIHSSQIDVSWPLPGTAQGATDSASGVAGYSYLFSTGSTDVPPEIKIADESTIATSSSTLTDGSWYFHLRTVDRANNWSDPVRIGPLAIGVPTSSSSSTTTTSTSTSSECTDSVPGSAPNITTTIPSENSITLRWSKAKDPVTYYLIAYGTNKGIYRFGNPNIGGKEISEYTIKGLSPATKYYLVLRAGNSCTPGPYSQEVAVTTAGGHVETPVIGLNQEVLGEATGAGLLSQGQAKPSENETLTSDNNAGREIIWPINIIIGILLVCLGGWILKPIKPVLPNVRIVGI